MMVAMAKANQPRITPNHHARRAVFLRFRVIENINTAGVRLIPRGKHSMGAFARSALLHSQHRISLVVYFLFAQSHFNVFVFVCMWQASTLFPASDKKKLRLKICGSLNSDRQNSVQKHVQKKNKIKKKSEGAKLQNPFKCYICY